MRQFRVRPGAVEIGSVENSAAGAYFPKEGTLDVPPRALTPFHRALRIRKPSGTSAASEILLFGEAMPSDALREDVIHVRARDLRRFFFFVALAERNSLSLCSLSEKYEKSLALPNWEIRSDSFLSFRFVMSSCAWIFFSKNESVLSSWRTKSWLHYLTYIA